MNNLYNQKDHLSQEKQEEEKDEELDIHLETRYMNLILDTLSTIPPKYRKRAMQIITRWIEEGRLSFGTDKERFGTDK